MVDGIEVRGNGIFIPWSVIDSARGIIRIKKPCGPKPSARLRAEGFLRDELKKSPRTIKEIYSLAFGLGISESTLVRARKRLGLLTEKHGDGPWIISLPDPVMAASKTEDQVQA